jgi:hypothetical protein
MEDGEELNPGRARYRYLSVMVGQSTQLLSNITPHCSLSEASASEITSVKLGYDGKRRQSLS